MAPCARMPTCSPIYTYAKRYPQYWYQYFNGEEGREVQTRHFIVFTSGTRRIMIKQTFSADNTLSVREESTVHERLLTKKPTDVSKAKAPLIVPPWPLGDMYIYG